MDALMADLILMWLVVWILGVLAVSFTAIVVSLFLESWRGRK